MSEGVLKPLGHPSQTGAKYFATSVLEELLRNAKWLARASDCIVHYWRVRNERKAVNRDRHEALVEETSTSV